MYKNCGNTVLRSEITICAECFQMGNQLKRELLRTEEEKVKL